MLGRSRSWTQFVSTLALCCVSSITVTAVGQTSAGNKAAAEALFNEGRTLMQQENYPEACKKLEASQALDVGLGTLMLLSDCYEKIGKTASAWATFKEAAAAARAGGDQDRETVARARAEALEPQLAKALVQASERTLSLSGLEVLMNGQLIPIAQLGTPVPIDPGNLTVTASAAGYKTWELTMEVVDGPSETTVDIPDLEPDSETTPPAQPETFEAKPEAAATPQDQAALQPEPEPTSDLATIGIAVGAAGVVGVAVGSYFGLKASSKYDESQKNCEQNRCNKQGFDLREDAQGAATVSTITFGIGTALLATGVVLYLIAPDDGAPNDSLSLSASPQVGGARLSLGGTW